MEQIIAVSFDIWFPRIIIESRECTLGRSRLKHKCPGPMALVFVKGSVYGHKVVWSQHVEQHCLSEGTVSEIY